MSKLFIEDTTLTAIGDAIRGKTGKEELINPANMPAEIDALKLQDYTIEDGLLEGALIGEYTNDRITKLRAYALYGITLTSFSSNSVTSAGVMALMNSKIAEINLPNLVTVGTQAFHGITTEYVELPKATFETAPMSVFNSSTGLKEGKFPAAIKFGGQMFWGCAKLSKIDVGANITAIGSLVFDNSGLSTLIIRNSNSIAKLENINSFNRCPISYGTGYIYVPKALLSDEDETKDYRRATNWVNFANQFRAIEDYPEICGGAE